MPRRHRAPAAGGRRRRKRRISTAGSATAWPGSRCGTVSRRRKRSRGRRRRRRSAIGIRTGDRRRRGGRPARYSRGRTRMALVAGRPSISGIARGGRWLIVGRWRGGRWHRRMRCRGRLGRHGLAGGRHDRRNAGCGRARPTRRFRGTPAARLLGRLGFRLRRGHGVRHFRRIVGGFHGFHEKSADSFLEK